MKCELCSKTATEKHHIMYYPERTIPVCGFHGDDIHNRPSNYSQLLQFKKKDPKKFYSQQKRISKFLKYLSKKKKRYGRR
jgi:hypothetical protein